MASESMWENCCIAETYLALGKLFVELLVKLQKRKYLSEGIHTCAELSFHENHGQIGHL